MTKNETLSVEFGKLEKKVNAQLEYYRDGWAHASLNRREMAEKLTETCDKLEAAAGDSIGLNARVKACRDRVTETLRTETATILTEVLAVFGKCRIEDEE